MSSLFYESMHAEHFDHFGLESPSSRRRMLSNDVSLLSIQAASGRGEGRMKIEGG